MLVAKRCYTVAVGVGYAELFLEYHGTVFSNPMLGECASQGIDTVEEGADREQTALTLEVFGVENVSTACCQQRLHICPVRKSHLEPL
jgi:hypothetical protein